MRWLLPIVLCGCSSPARYEVVLLSPVGDPLDGATTAELDVLDEGCPADTGEPGDVVRHVTWRIDEEAPDVGALALGRYGWSARVRQADCRAGWAGCKTAAVIGSGAGRIEIELVAVDGGGCEPPAICDGEGSCVTPPDDDEDGDGANACAPEGSSVDCDCDDGDPDVHPGADELPGGLCNGIDDDCDGLIDDRIECRADDLDGDGATVLQDCNDCSAAMHPGATAVCGNDRDEDCTLGGVADGKLLPAGADACPDLPRDADGDGATREEDCDDADPARAPGAPDECGDEVDQDCDGLDANCDEGDLDGDAWNEADDCQDDDEAIHPGQPDPCNGIDDDCDGLVDEDLAPGTGCILPAAAGGAWRVIDFQTTLAHCGTCRTDCNAGCAPGEACRADACVSGVCSCGGGVFCAGTDDETCCEDGCRDLSADVDNCGDCGRRCPAPDCRIPVCIDGDCSDIAAPDGTACGAGGICCGGACGECTPGENEDDECLSCGRRDRTCGDDCMWGPYTICNQPQPCP